MKVVDAKLTGTAATGAPPAGAPGREEGARNSPAGHPAPFDRVELSGPAAGIGRLLGSQAGARAGRVAGLARAVQAGRYHPDAAQTSRAIVAETLGAVAEAKAGKARGVPK